MAIIQLTPTGASGEGTNQLSPTNFGVNTSRSSQRSTTFTAGENGLNRLTITQNPSPSLFIDASADTSQSIVSPSSSTTWSISGSTNGKYMKYSISNGVTVSSAKEYSNNTSQGSSIGTSYSSVSSFVGGSQEFEYRVTISIPSGLSAGTYTLTVYSSDIQNGGGAVNQTFTLRVTAQAVDVQSVSIKSLGSTVTTLDIGKGTSYKYNNQTITVNSNSRNKLTYEVSPQDASVVSAAWSSSNTSVATVSSSGLVTGKSEGTATITCTVTDANGNTASATCTVNVYNEGQITLGGNITIPYNSTTAQTTVGYTNVNSSSSTQVHFATKPWLNSVVLSSGNTALVAERVTTSQTTLPESTSVYVTGVDILGNTVTSNTVTVSQQMVISIDGPSTINNDDNIGSYTMSYLPFDITGSDSAVGWSFSTQQQHASITGATTSECSITVLDGATGDSAVLVATNIKDSTITGQKAVTMTYNAPGTITVNPASVSNIAFDATSDNSVSVTIDRVTDITFGCSGFIDSAEIVNGKLVAHFTANSTLSQRSGSVVIGGESGGEPVTASVMYSQNAHPGTLGSVNITSLHANLNAQGRPESADIGVIFTNNATNKRTFSNITYELICFNSSDEQVYSGTGTFTSVPVNASSYVDQALTITGISATDAVTQYNLSISCTYDSSTLTANYSGDGTDSID